MEGGEIVPSTTTDTIEYYLSNKRTNEQRIQIVSVCYTRLGFTHLRHRLWKKKNRHHFVAGLNII